MIDREKIINDTIAVFKNSKERLSNIRGLEKEKYRKLHYQPLVPLNIKIDPYQFHQEIIEYDYAFEQWGKDHTHLSRYGAALVNRTGTIHKDDPINGSLTEWNSKNPQIPIIETDCTVPTEILDLPSLSPLRILDGYWCRSNILKWNEGAKFLPHIDTILPAPWIRLWATTCSDNILVKFYIDNDIVTPNIESGRVYLIDTSIVHEAECLYNTNYQLFLSLSTESINILEKEILYG